MKDKFVLDESSKKGIALTFDDVRLRTGYSEVLPDNVDIGSRFSRNVSLKAPIVSAAMDTVTEYKMAIQIAKLGGIGVIHRNLSVEEQAFNVSKVKHHLNGLIEKPVCVFENDSIKSIFDRIEEKKFTFRSFPVLNNELKIVGLITRNDFDFCDSLDCSAKDIMSIDLLTAPQETTVEEAFVIMKKEKKKVLPLIDGNGFLAGMYSFSDVKRVKTGALSSYNLDSKGRLRVAAAVGVGEEALRRVRALVEKDVDVIVIDTAHGDTKLVIDTLKKIKSEFAVDVVVGNVSVGESARRLAEAGADGIKVGQGGGSICTTRIIAGIGRPQVSAIYDCAKAVESFGIPICADGGLRHSGDIPIAIAAGAHSVMMGSMLAGTEEAPGEVVFYQGRKWKVYRGMGSLEAMKSNESSRERYLQGEGKKQIIPEGVEGLVPCKGNVEETIFQYLGGLRRGMGYAGANTIEELREKGEFDQISLAGIQESHTHDVLITKDSPNYTKEI
ncbi:IMP dehydrogenase [Candidatus Pacearchaeota archaeon]|nr:IMP dehydrogenase [Candidatus Pacearchaeota archaeon]